MSAPKSNHGHFKRLRERSQRRVSKEKLLLLEGALLPHGESQKECTNPERQRALAAIAFQRYLKVYIPARNSDFSRKSLERLRAGGTAPRN